MKPAFIWKDRKNRVSLGAALILVVVGWAVFKSIYPYPNLVFDSYSYIRAAAQGLNVNAWPIGYSKFLQFYNFFSHSANLLVTFQYAFLECSCLLFFFTWLHFFRPGRYVRLGVFLLLFANPLFLYCSNYILSDAIFIGLSIIWITQLLWILYRPRPWMIITHTLLIVVAFMIRYNAIYYPLVSVLAFILSRQRPWLKITGIALPPFFLVLFILFTSSQSATITGERQFSAFGGWKLANDALYAYAHVPGDQVVRPPEKFRVLDSTVRRFLDTAKNAGDLLKIDPSSGSLYMFDPNTPLVQYMWKRYGAVWPFIGEKEWFVVAPLFQSYGAWLVRTYPSAFARHFLLPNFLRYAVPQNEIFGARVPYYLVDAYGAPIAMKFFGLTTITVDEYAIDLSRKILLFYPIFFTFIHIIFLVGLSGFLFLGGLKKIGRPYANCLLLVAFLWCCDFGFSVLSAGIVLRYQVFVITLEAAFGLYFMEYIYRDLDRSTKKDNAVALPILGRD
jgi:hypothetical protein